MYYSVIDTQATSPHMIHISYVPKFHNYVWSNYLNTVGSMISKSHVRWPNEIPLSSTIHQSSVTFDHLTPTSFCCCSLSLWSSFSCWFCRSRPSKFIMLRPGLSALLSVIFHLDLSMLTLGFIIYMSGINLQEKLCSFKK